MLKRIILSLSTVFASVQSASAQEIELHYGYSGNTINRPLVLTLDNPILKDFLILDDLAKEWPQNEVTSGAMIIVDDPEFKTGGFIVGGFIFIVYPAENITEYDLENKDGMIFKYKNSSGTECVFVAANAGDLDVSDRSDNASRLSFSFTPQILSEISRTGCVAFERRGGPQPT